MSNKLTNPLVVVNNIPVAIVPNSFKYTEGKGEQKAEVQSAGGNAVDMVYSDDVSTKKSKVSFSLYPTEDNIAAAREWKSNRNANLITATQGSFGRTFRQAALLNDYEVMTTADGTLELQFESQPAA